MVNSFWLRFLAEHALMRITEVTEITPGIRNDWATAVFDTEALGGIDPIIKTGISDDTVVIGELGSASVIIQLQVKGGDYSPEEIVGSEYIKQRGGQVKVIPFVDGYSTSKIISAILDKN